MSLNPSSPGGRSDGPGPPPNEPRLESWGEIAAYLRRDIRTVQRWEKEAGLPVRRLQIGKQGQVYAYRSEVDRWVVERQPRAEPEPPATPSASPSPSTILPGEGGKTDPWFRRVWKVVLAGLIVAGLGTYFVFQLVKPKAAASRTPARLLLFVRPFANLSSGPSEQEFVDGLTDEMITQLGRVKPNSIGVFAPTTSKELGTRSIPELKELLKTDFVLEGSVRRADQQIRIDINLISARDRTPTWANSYTSDVHKVLAFQDEVVTDVVKHLLLTLPSTDAAKPSDSPASRAASLEPAKEVQPVDPKVYEAYLAGRLYLLDRDFPRSMTLFQQALRIDPQYPPALAGLGMSVLLLGETPNDAFPPATALPRARQAAYQALALDPHLSDAYCVLANVSQGYDHDLAGAERFYSKAIELDPNNVTALKWYADYLFVTKHLLEASRQIDKALEIDPASPLINTAKAEVKYYYRDFDGAIAQAQRTLDAHPEFLLARFWLASAYRQKGMYAEALNHFNELHKRYPDNSALLMAYGHTLALSGDRSGARKVLATLQSRSKSHYVPALYIAGMYSGLGDMDQAFRWLEHAYEDKNDRLVYLGVDPIADPLRADPRFSGLMRKVGLPQ